MAKSDFKTIDAYIAAQPAPAQTVLNRVRAAIRNALPDAEETISYQIPAYKLGGSPVIYFAGWKRHFSLYPASAALIAAFADELTTCEISKGTIRFPLGTTIPVRLIQRIAKFRAAETASQLKAKPAKTSATK
jgi:uncharacterized protein YdhG (YjbR/CyaY superfamily)